MRASATGVEQGSYFLARDFGRAATQRADQAARPVEPESDLLRPERGKESLEHIAGLGDDVVGGGKANGDVGDHRKRMYAGTHIRGVHGRDGGRTD